MPTEWDFAGVYRQHHRRIYNLCAYLLNSRDAAEDAVHEVFLRLDRKIETYDPALPLMNWILRVASNYCVDVLRRRGREKRLFGSDPETMPEFSSAQPSPLGEMLTSEQGEKVRRALASLPDKYRVPLVLAYYNEFSYAEIASALQVPRDTVATLLLRGKQRLREKLKKEKPHELS